MMDNFEISEKIIEQVLPKYFKFIIFESEITEEGNSIKLYSDFAQKLQLDIIKVLENGK